MIKLTINRKPVEIPAGTTIYDAARTLGIHIPIFCHHPKLKTIGACRMCLVEWVGKPMLMPSCHTSVQNDMEILTDSPRVREEQKSVLDLILTTHPLECPGCDVGGNCELQNATFKHTPGKSTIHFPPEKIHFEKISPLVDLDNRKCVLCYRCVRYCDEIEDRQAIGIISRGHATRIAGFPEQCSSCGGCIEICPVAALSSPQNRHVLPSWELEDSSMVCHYCDMGCRVGLEVGNKKILRGAWADSGNLNDFEWPYGDRGDFESRAETTSTRNDGNLCSLGYYGIDVYTSPERLTTPLLRKKNRLVETSWEEALSWVKNNGIDKTNPGALVSPRLSSEALYLFSGFFLNHYPSSVIGQPYPDWINGFVSAGDPADGTGVWVYKADIPSEIPVLGQVLKRRGMKISYPGDDISVLKTLLKNTARDDIPGILVFSAVKIKNEDFDGLKLIKKTYPGIRFLPITGRNNSHGLFMEKHAHPGRFTSISSVLDGYKSGQLKSLYVLGDNPIESGFDLERVQNRPIVVQDIMRTATTEIADCVLPAAAPAESGGTYFNIFGIHDETPRSVPAPGCARTDANIILMIAEAVGQNLSGTGEVKKIILERKPLVGSNPDHAWAVVEMTRRYLHVSGSMSRYSTALQKLNPRGEKK